MEERVELALAAAVRRMESGEEITPESLRREHPDCWEILCETLGIRELIAGPRPFPVSIGPYRILRRIGDGGMGIVYLAESPHAADGDAAGRVAVKVVHPHLLDGSTVALARFLREAEIGRCVRHENVVRTLNAGAADIDGRSTPFLAMEYVEGTTLRALLDESGKLPEALCRHVGREVARGLAAIHAAGAVHRDLKPENVIVTQSRVVKIMDLGVARLVDQATRLSGTGTFVGSLRYAAPEQFGGTRTAEEDVVDGRADLYALGLVLYELACGAHPFEGSDFRELVRRQISERPRRLGEANPQVSPVFEEVVHTLLEKDRGRRLASLAPGLTGPSCGRSCGAQELAALLEEGEESAWWKSRAQAIRAETKRPLRRMRIPRETALFGRDKELALLRSLYERASKGDGQVAVVEGEAGIGKSRLVDEFVGLLEREGEDLHFLSGGHPPGGAATAADAFRDAFREHFGDEGLDRALAERLPATPSLVPAFVALLRGDATPVGAEPLTRQSLQTLFVHAATALAAERPTIIVIEDLHFATDDARAVFASVAHAARAHRLLLVATTRPGLDSAWISSVLRPSHGTRLQLARLSCEDLGKILVEASRSQFVADDLSREIAAKSDGNPFFVFEILSSLREQGLVVRRHDGAWTRVAPIADIEVPSTVLELVQGRLAGLCAEDRDVLEAASCAGFEFDPRLVAESLSLHPIAVLQRFGRIEHGSGLVRSAGATFVFDHHVVQETLYAGISRPLREEYHAAIGESLERRTGAGARDSQDIDGAVCVALAEHLVKGNRGPQGLRYLDAAYAHLVKRYLNAQAVALAERALAIPGLLAGVERARVLLRLCAVNGPLDRLGRRARQEEAAREAECLSEEAGEDDLRGQAARALGVVLCRTSRDAEAEAPLRRALEIARARGDRKTEAAVTGSLGTLLGSEGRLIEAREHHERHLALSREIGDKRSEAGATGNLGLIFQFEGRIAEARAQHERCLALCRETGDRVFEGLATGNLGDVFRSEGRLAQAREHFERFRALSREIGDREGEGTALHSLGQAWLALGDRDRAGQALEQSLALCRETGSHFVEGRVLLDLGQLADESGDIDAAGRLLAESLALHRKSGHATWVTESLLAIADLLARAGDADGARTALDEAVPMLREQGRADQVALGQAMLACLPGGDAKAAAAALAHAGENEHSRRARWLLWTATGDRAHLADAKRLLDEALAKVPAEHHEAMLANVRLNREIAEAWARGLPDRSDQDATNE